MGGLYRLAIDTDKNYFMQHTTRINTYWNYVLTKFMIMNDF